MNNSTPHGFATVNDEDGFLLYILCPFCSTKMTPDMTSCHCGAIEYSNESGFVTFSVEVGVPREGG